MSPKFEIRLDIPDHRFAPGDIVAGRVILELTQPEIIRSLRVKFKGLSKIHWKRPQGSHRYTQNSLEEIYFSENVYVVEEIEGETAELETGLHEFRFQFSLPNNLPSSFYGDHGSVTYSIKAVMDRPLKIDYETFTFFAVDTPLDLTQCSVLSESLDQQLLSAIEDDELENVSCCSCIHFGTVKLKVSVPSNYFNVGESIEAKIYVDSTLSNLEVTKIELRLEQMVRLRTPQLTRKETYTIKTVEDVRRFSRMDETVLRMQVPSLPHSYLMHCSIIDIEYSISVRLSIRGIPCRVERKYPILIGKMPTLNIENASLTTISTAMPTAPFFPNESRELMDRMTVLGPHGDNLLDGTWNEGNGPELNLSRPVSCNSLIPSNQNSPRMPRRTLGFITPNPGQATSSDRSMERPPPSYNEVVDVNDKR